MLEKLFDPELANEVKPADYSFRLSIKLETGDERYKEKVNTGIWIGSGARRGAEGEISLHSRFSVPDRNYQQLPY